MEDFKTYKGYTQQEIDIILILSKKSGFMVGTYINSFIEGYSAGVNAAEIAMREDIQRFSSEVVFNTRGEN